MEKKTTLKEEKKSSETETPESAISETKTIEKKILKKATLKTKKSESIKKVIKKKTPVSREKISKPAAAITSAAVKTKEKKSPKKTLVAKPEKKIGKVIVVKPPSSAGVALTSKEVPVVELPALKRSTPQPAVAQPAQKPEIKSMPKIEPAPDKKILINEMVTAKMVAEKLNIPINDLIKKMLSMGTLVTINQRLDQDTCMLIAQEYGYTIEWVALYGDKETGPEEKEDAHLLKPRPPIVTVMGHVDHGKTSLLDAIRKTNVAGKEAGGITQHIGAYRVKTPHGEIVFLDTPGHEAFTAMRARGAQVTDIVVLLVAADDGVMPQTVEAIDHARAANVPIMVAINKIDLPGANVQKVKQQLAQYNLIPEEWGGKTVTVEVSATNLINIDKLLEMILLQAEMMELKANPNRSTLGVVVEARLDPKKGPVATVLVRKGTLRIGDSFVAGLWNGRVRALIDDVNRHVREAGPSIPVEVLGLSGTPQAGDRFVVVHNEREGRIIAERRQSISREESLGKRKHLTLENLKDRITEGAIQELKVIIKADVQGSVEALRDSLEKLSTAKISLKVLHYGVGGIVESDVILATASDAIIIGFNVRPELQAEKFAQKEGVDIRTYRIIYDVVNDIRAAMEGLLEPETKEVPIGRAEIREVFRIPKIGAISGCMVVDGRIERNAFIRLLRNNVIIYEGKISSLRRFKDDVHEVEKGFECGIGLENYQDIKKGDILEVFIKEQIQRSLGA